MKNVIRVNFTITPAQHKWLQKKKALGTPHSFWVRKGLDNLIKKDRKV